MRSILFIDGLFKPSGDYQAWLDPLFRVLTSLIFIIGGAGHFGAHAYMLARIDESPWRDVVIRIGDPSWLLWLSGLAFVIFGICLAVGFVTRLSAAILLITLVPITIAIHIAPGHTGPLLKNVAIMGALIHFICVGGGKASIDNRVFRRIYFSA